jgi:hypothetical protein
MVESYVKHHNPNPTLRELFLKLRLRYVHPICDLSNQDDQNRLIRGQYQSH